MKVADMLKELEQRECYKAAVLGDLSDGQRNSKDKGLFAHLKGDRSPSSKNESNFRRRKHSSATAKQWLKEPTIP